MKTVKAANGCRLTKGTQPYCWCQVHLFVSDWLLVCLLLSATFAVCCFTFPSLSVQPRCVYFSLSLSNKKGRNHTRQELNSRAANSRSRWSIFSFSFQNERTKWKLWPYMWSSAEQSSWDCFQLRAFHFVSVISQLLFYFIYSSSDLHTSTSLSLHGAPLHRCTARSAASEWLHPVLYRGFVPRGSFHSSHLHSFFFFCMWDIFRKRQVFLLSR